MHTNSLRPSAIAASLAFLAVFTGTTLALQRSSLRGQVGMTDSARCQSIKAPKVLEVGKKFLAEIVVTNDGTTTWPVNGNYRLGTAQPHDNMTFGFSRILVTNEAVKPLSTKAFVYRGQAPQRAGTYTFAFQMVNEGVRWFGTTCAMTIEVKQSVRPSAFIRIVDAPDSMPAGTTAWATVEAENVGDVSWSTGWPQEGNAHRFRLGSQWPQDNAIWGLTRVDLGPYYTVDPGQKVQMRFLIRAPNTPGKYPFVWQMLQEQIRWFDFPGGKAITVTLNASVTPDDFAQCTGLGLPKNVRRGQTFYGIFHFKNTGKQTWTDDYRPSVSSNALRPVGRIGTPTAVPPNGSRFEHVKFTVDAAAPLGEQPVRVRLRKGNEETPGATCDAVVRVIDNSPLETTGWQETGTAVGAEDFVAESNYPQNFPKGLGRWMTLAVYNTSPRTWSGLRINATSNTSFVVNRNQSANVVEPGGVTLVSAFVTAPNQTGQHPLDLSLSEMNVNQSVRLLRGTGQNKIVNVTGGEPPRVGDNADVVRVEAPASRAPGSFDIPCTMRNSGTSAWQPGLITFRRDGTSELPAENGQLTQIIAPGQTVTVTIPASLESWQIGSTVTVRGRMAALQGMAWQPFGQTCEAKIAVVSAGGSSSSSPAAPRYDALLEQFYTDSSALEGQIAEAEILVRNTGDATWQPKEVRLQSTYEKREWNVIEFAPVTLDTIVPPGDVGRFIVRYTYPKPLTGPPDIYGANVTFSATLSASGKPFGSTISKKTYVALNRPGLDTTVGRNVTCDRPEENTYTFLPGETKVIGDFSFRNTGTQPLSDLYGDTAVIVNDLRFRPRLLLLNPRIVQPGQTAKAVLVLQAPFEEVTETQQTFQFAFRSNPAERKVATYGAGCPIRLSVSANATPPTSSAPPSSSTASVPASSVASSTASSTPTPSSASSAPSAPTSSAPSSAPTSSSSAFCSRTADPKAELIGHTIPTVLPAGVQVPVILRYKNTGTGILQPCDIALATGAWQGSQIIGIEPTRLPSLVMPNAIVDIPATLRAPTAAGSNKLNIFLKQERGPNLDLFTKEFTITDTSLDGTYGAYFTRTTLPTTAEVGEIITPTFTFRNIGSKTLSPMDTSLVIRNRDTQQVVASAALTQPAAQGEEFTFTTSLTMPDQTGDPVYEWTVTNARYGSISDAHISSIQVQTQRPRLTHVSSSVPAQAVVGQQTQASIVVRNDSGHEISLQGIRLQARNQYGGAILFDQEVSPATVPANGTATLPFTFTPTAPGNLYIALQLIHPDAMVAGIFPQPLSIFVSVVSAEAAAQLQANVFDVNIPGSVIMFEPLSGTVTIENTGYPPLDPSAVTLSVRDYASRQTVASIPLPQTVASKQRLEIPVKFALSLYPGRFYLQFYLHDANGNVLGQWRGAFVTILPR